MEEKRMSVEEERGGDRERKQGMDAERENMR